MSRRLVAAILARPRTVVSVWLAAAGISVVLVVFGPGEIGNLGYSVPGSGSARAGSVLRRYLPGHSGSTVFALMSAHGPPQTGSANLATATRTAALGQGAQITRALRRLQRLGDVGSVEEISEPTEILNAGQAPDALIVIAAIDLKLSQANAEDRLPAIEASLRRASVRNVSLALVGGLIVSRDYSIIARQDLARAERISLPVSFAALLIAFLSVVAAALPVAMAAVTLVATLAMLHLLSLHAGLSVFAVNTASVVALGLSIDYALFIVARFREERQTAASVDRAIARTMDTAGRAVVISGLTIALSLAALLAVGVGLFSSMAVGGIIASLTAMLAATTLLPATICLLGDRLELLTLRPAANAARRGGLWRRLAHLVTRRPLAAALSSLVLLLALAIPAHSLRLSFRNISELPSGTPMTRTLAHIASVYGPGATGPMEIVTTNPQAVTAVLAADGSAQPVSDTVTGRGGWHAMRVILDSTPDSEAASATVTRLRRKLDGIAGRSYIGGLSASDLDLTSRVASRMGLVVAIAVLVGLIALAVGLRSIVIPIKAVLCSLLSVTATIGVLLLCFPAGDGLAFFVPLFVFALVFGLSVDYEVFLLSRVREAVQAGYSTADAVSLGLIRSARPITLAGLTVASVFAAFAFSSLEAFRELGVGLAVAVILDVSVVRCVLVPACIVLFGRWNWWWPSLRGRSAKDAR